MFRCSDVLLFKCSNVQMFKCSVVRMIYCSNVPLFIVLYSLLIALPSAFRLLSSDYGLRTPVFLIFSFGCKLLKLFNIHYHVERIANKYFAHIVSFKGRYGHSKGKLNKCFGNILPCSNS